MWPSFTLQSPVHVTAIHLTVISPCDHHSLYSHQSMLPSFPYLYSHQSQRQAVEGPCDCSPHSSIVSRVPEIESAWAVSTVHLNILHIYDTHTFPPFHYRLTGRKTPTCLLTTSPFPSVPRILSFPNSLWVHAFVFRPMAFTLATPVLGCKQFRPPKWRPAGLECLIQWLENEKERRVDGRVIVIDYRSSQHKNSRTAQNGP